MPARKVITIVLILGLHLIPRLAVPQKIKKGTDAATLRARFIAAFGKDFELVSDQLKARSVSHGGGIFWLAFVKPKHTGHFYLQYRYREEELLNIREHERRFKIGPQSCQRGVPESRTYTRFCLGDTIILPVLVNNYSGHEFNLAKAEYTNGAEESPESKLDAPTLDTSAIANPAAPMLQYLGRSHHRLLHRIPGYTLTLGATFQAQQPGRMNLFVIAEGEAPSHVQRFDGVPIIVLPREAPATLIAGREEVRDYQINKDGSERLYSTTSNIFMTDVLILQPGDQIQVTYFSIDRNRDDVGNRFNAEGTDPAEQLKPVISVRPFAIDSNYEFTEWIVDHLPKS